MCIEHIEVRDILGVRHLSADLAPLVVVAGGNGAGKTSLLQAIRYGITGEMPARVLLKKDAAALVSDGARSGSVELTYGSWIGDDVIRRMLPEAGRMQPPSIFQHAAARCGLDAHLFGRLSTSERRKLLGDVVGTGDAGTWVALRLADEKIDAARIDTVLPILLGGFDAGATYAGEKASEARGAWRAITGEAYGSKKAESWAAKTPTKPEGDADSIDAELATANAELQAVTEQIGRAKAIAEAPSEERIANLRDKALPEAIEKLEALRDELRTLDAEARGNQGVTAQCPCCQKLLVIDGATLREAIEPRKPATDAFAQAKELRSKIAGAEQWVAVKRGELATMEARRAAVAELADELPPLAELEDRAALLRQDIARLRGLAMQIGAHSREVQQAEAKTREAAANHAAVEQWSAVAKLLQPDGLPAELLAKQLQPIRERLSLPGGVVTLGDDMELRLNGRAYALLSESEQWRVDVAISLAVCGAGGVPLLLIDRLDVIEPANRMPILHWLAGITSAGGPQVIVAATLKAKPALQMAQVIWMGEDLTTAKAA